MKDRKLAARYARALLAVLPDPAAAASADEFLAALAEAMRSQAALKDVLLNPAVPSATQKNVLVALAEAHGGSQLMKNFLSTIADHRRTAAIPTIAEIFREVREAERGIVAATLTTAMALPPELQQRVEAALQRLSGRSVKLSLQIDPALIGGVVTQVGSNIFDGSVRTQLDRLHRRMTEE